MKESETNIILDIDNTLIVSSERKLNKNPDFEIKLGEDKFYVYKRHNLNKFIDYIFRKYKSVSIWTAATKPYCDKILKNIFTHDQREKLRFIWTRNKTINKYGYLYLKDLSKVFKKFRNFNNKNTILLDDNTDHFITSGINVVYIPPLYKVDTNDNHLIKSLTYIKKCKVLNHSS